MMLLLIDNFDSFTYNLAQYFQVLGANTQVIRNNVMDADLYKRLSPDLVVIGPGPGGPSQAGISKDLILKCAGTIPVFGVCLGLQCLADAYGGRIIRANKPMHGKTSPIYHDGCGVFKNLPQGFLATRYHSLIADKGSLPDCLEVTAHTEEGEIMGLRHREFPDVEAVQFHPESVVTEQGMALLENFVQQANQAQVLAQQTSITHYQG